MLKARFSRIFASLRMGGVAIDSVLQVGFMLRALLSSYHGIVQDFRLGHHSLSTATLQTLVDQCVAYDKDTWKSPVNKTGKPVRTPSANAAGTTQGTGGTRTRQPWGGLWWPQRSGQQTRRGCMTGVLHPLPWEPDSDNQKVVTALARKGEATGEQETQRGVCL